LKNTNKQKQAGTEGFSWFCNSLKYHMILLVKLKVKFIFSL
jgi:hypothetical protein